MHSGKSTKFINVFAISVAADANTNELETDDGESDDEEVTHERSNYLKVFF